MSSWFFYWILILFSDYFGKRIGKNVLKINIEWDVVEIYFERESIIGVRVWIFLGGVIKWGLFNIVKKCYLCLILLNKSYRNVFRIILRSCLKGVLNSFWIWKYGILIL